MAKYSIQHQVGVVQRKLCEFFSKEKIQRLSHETAFVQRRSAKISGFDLLKSLIIGSCQGHITSLQDQVSIAVEIGCKHSISKQALSARINRKSAEVFFCRCLEEAFKIRLKKIAMEEGDLGEVLGRFDRVLVEDSTQFSLHESLQLAFKGVGGAASKAACKLNVVYDLKALEIVKCTIQPGAVPDRKIASDILTVARSSDLIIRDLGYFYMQVFEQLKNQGSLYISRIPGNIHVYLNADDEQPASFGKFLLKKCSGTWDSTVFIGKEKMPVRLVAYRAPQEVAAKRRAKLRLINRKAGKTPSEENLARMDFTIFITNVCADIFSTKIIATLYRIRWQIELLFKTWKSQFKIHEIKGMNEHRIKCLIFARLITLMITTVIYALIRNIVIRCGIREPSLQRVVSWLLLNNRLGKIIQTGLRKDLLDLLFIDLSRTFCEGTRQRKTTRQRIVSKEPYPHADIHSLEYELVIIS